MAATISSSCGSFFTLRSTNSRDSSSSSHGSPRKLDGLALWFINGVTMAFFASLEHCSCIRIATHEDGENANDLPLILNDGNLRHRDGGGGATSRRRTVKGKKSGATFVDHD